MIESPSASPAVEHPRRRFLAARVVRVVVAVVAGLTLAVAFDPWALGELAPVAVGALLWTQTRAGSMKDAFLIGTVGGFAFMSTHIWWLQESIGSGAWLVVSLSQSLWFGLVGIITALVWSSRAAPPLVAACWVSVELARQTFPFGGFPWGRVGVSVLDTPWAGLLPLGGVNGAGFVVVLLAAAVVHVVERPSRTRTAGVAAVLAASLVPVWAPLTVDVDGTLAVAVVQGDVPGEGDDIARYGPEVTASHVAATTRLGEQVAAGEVEALDLVVWPENSTTTDPFENGTVRAGIEQAVEAVDVPVLVGAIVDASDPKKVLNQGVVWSPSGPQVERYTKHHPVPFGEYIPFRRLLGGLSDRFDEIPRDMIAGRGSEPLRVSGALLANAICFDVAYEDVIGPQVRAGAQLVVVQTSNATFVGTDQVDQQFAITRARAAEVGRATVVASTNGVSGLISSDGSVVSRSPKRETSVAQAELPLSSDLTPAVRWAKPIQISLIAVSLLAVVAPVAQCAVRAMGRT